MAFTARFVFGLIFFSLVALAGPAGDSRDMTEPQPIPPFKVVNSDRPSFQASIGGMVVSDPYQSGFPWVKTGTDTTDVEVQMLSDFVNETGQFASNQQVQDKSQLFVYLNRYDMGDPRVTGLLIKAHQKGMNVQFITDLSRTAKVQFGEDGRYKDFYKLKPEDFLDNQKGQQIATMLKAGARFANPTTGDLTPEFGIYGIMYEERPGVENPLEHMKGMLLGRKVNGQVTQIWGTDGSGNMGRHEAEGAKDLGTRSNRMLIESDPLYLMNNLNHFETMRDAYAKGGETKDIPLPKVPPMEEHFPNGDIRRVMFTDGQYNPHDMTAFTLLRSVIEDDQAIERVGQHNPHLKALIDRELESGAIPKKNVRITKVKMKEFLLTNRSILEALKLAMRANPDLKVEGAVDQEFAGLESQGLIGPLMGFESIREFGGATRGATPDIYRRVNLRIYQRMIEGQKETDRGTSWLTHYLLHDKTIMIWVQEPDGKEKVHIFTKSFNMSSHVDNAEELDEIIVDANSEVARAFEESIDKPIASEPQWYIDGPTAIIRDSIGRLTGHTDTEVELKDVHDLLEAYHQKKFDVVRQILERIGRKPSSLENYKNLTPEKLQARLDRMGRFLEWQARNDGDIYNPQYADSMNRRFAAFAALIANQDPLDEREKNEIQRPPFEVWQMVHDVLWKKDLEHDYNQRSQRDTQVWKEVLQYGEIPKDPLRPPGSHAFDHNGDPRADVAHRPWARRSGDGGNGQYVHNGSNEVVRRDPRNSSGNGGGGSRNACRSVRELSPSWHRR